MSDAIFVDTNVLVYALDASEPLKQKQAAAWIHHLWRTGTGRVSFQVLQEFYVSVTAKLSPGMKPGDAREVTRSFLAWRPLPADARILEGAWIVQDRYGLSWWDSLIVSAAQASGCRHLLTEDLQEGRTLGDLQVLHPFHSSPPEEKTRS